MEQLGKSDLLSFIFARFAYGRKMFFIYIARSSRDDRERVFARYNMRTGCVSMFLATVLFCGCASTTRVAAISSSPILETGTQDGAAFRIDIPRNWNHDLVVYYHGYAVDPIPFPASEPLIPQVKPMFDRGYAVIQSAYSRTGWAIEQGYADTEKLRQYFGAKYGTPRETFVTGLSMGGALTVMTLENEPENYVGGLAFCGALMPSDALQQKAFAMRAAFDYYFPGLLGPLVPIPADFAGDDVTTKKISAAMRANPQAAQALANLSGVGALHPGVVSFMTVILKELQQRTHGHPFGNADLIYTGSGDDDALNDGVQRYRADPKAAAYLARFYTPSGKLSRPLLALHDTGDPLVPASSANDYAMAAQRNGNADRFVQKYINREGHCVFDENEMGRAFDELVDWVHNGKRPISGALK